MASRPLLEQLDSAGPSRISGLAEIIATPPRIELHEDVLCVPIGIPGQAPGLFSRTGESLTLSAHRRGIPAIHAL